MARHRYHNRNDTVENLTLGRRFVDIPFSVLRISPRSEIAKFLDLENDVIDNDTQRLTDWRGLAEIINLTNLEIRNLERAKSPTIDLLSQWEDSDSPTLADFWSCMLQLNRRDVLLECKDIIGKNII